MHLTHRLFSTRSFVRRIISRNVLRLCESISFPRSWQYFNVVLVCVGFLNWCWELIYWMAWQSMAVNWCKYIALFRLSFTSLPTLILQHLAAFEFHHDRSSRSTPKPVWLHHQQCRVDLWISQAVRCARVYVEIILSFIYIQLGTLCESTPGQPILSINICVLI